MKGFSMLRAYVDESERANTHYFLGALIANETQQEHIRNGFKELLNEFSISFPAITQSTEFHGSAIMRGADSPWREAPFRAKVDLYRKALLVIESSQAKVFLEGIDIARHRQRAYENHFEPRELAFAFLLERVNETCHRTNSWAVIIADDHHTAEESHSNFAKYQVTGTIGYKSSKLDRIVGPIEFTDSQNEACLQAADLVTYLFNRCRTIIEKEARTQRAKELLWQTIEPACVWSRGRARIWPA